MAFQKISLHSNVLPEDYLELVNGVTIENLPELAVILKGMTDETYNHHVTKSRNEFADFVEEGYGQEKLAKKLRKTVRKDRMVRLLEKALKKEQKSLQKADLKKLKKIDDPGSKRSVLEQLKHVDDHLHPGESYG